MISWRPKENYTIIDCVILILHCTTPIPHCIESSILASSETLPHELVTNELSAEEHTQRVFCAGRGLCYM